MADETIRLLAEIDATGVAAGARQAERTWGTSVDNMVAATQRADRAAAAWGANVTGAARLATRGIQAMSAAIGATMAGTAASERQWLSVGANLLQAFAGGGKLGLAVAATGAAIGALSGNSKRLREEALANAQAMGQWAVALGEVKGEALATALAFRSAGRESEGWISNAIEDLSDWQRSMGLAPWSDKATSPNEQRAELLKKARAEEQAFLRALGQEIEEFEGAADAGWKYLDVLERIQDAYERGLFFDSESPERERKMQETFERAEGYLQGQASRARLRADWDRSDRVQSAQDANEILGRQLLPGFNRTNELQAQLEIKKQQALIDRMMREWTKEELDAQKDILNALQFKLELTKEINDDQVEKMNRGLEREIQLLGVRNDRERELLQLRWRGEDMLDEGYGADVVARMVEARTQEIAQRPMRQFLQTAEQTLGRGLSDLIVDGIETGFENASQIGRQIWNSLLRQMIDDLVTSGLQGGLAGLLGGGGGKGGGLLSGLSGILGLVGSIFGGGGGGGGFAGYGSSSGGGILDVGFSDLGSGGSLDGSAIGGGFYETGMAAGGIVRKPTLRLLGERGPEAVVPLHKLGQMGSGVNVSVTVNVNGQDDLDRLAAIVGASVQQQLSESPAARAAIRKANRSL